VATARFVIGQLATLQSPRYLSIVLLCGREDDHGERDWGWARWLPHAEPTAGQSCEVLVGVGREQARARVAELTAVLEARLARHAGLGRWSGPRTVLVLDGARRLRELAGVARLLADGPAVGIHAVCIEGDPAALPAECGARAVVSGEVGGQLTVDAVGHDRVSDAVPDGVSERWAARLSRRLSRLRDATPDDDAGLPESIGLVDLVCRGASDPLKAGRLAAGSIAADWSRDGRRTEVPVGVGADGPLLVDLRRDGPHALVAGTTGAGKSELLQTLVASLALSNRPDELSFVLVDYKGGAAFAECAQLPHTLGMVTDLDEHLTERALASLSAEVERRERLLADVKAATLEDYQRSSEQSGSRLPRLVIVVDEFASLVEELPEFVRGLVGIAMRGRSLGVHLVLATQRPAGAVSADIRANVGLRIALRVADAADSTDVIDVPDAARIDRRTPGRAYVRRGSDAAVCFQAARVSGRSDETRSISVRAVSWSQLGDPPPVAAPAAARAHDWPSDLAGLVAATREAARLLGVTSPSSPWLPPLPERLSLDDLPTTAFRTGGLPVIPYGLADLPERGIQEHVSLDLEHGGHLMVVGAPRTGRSTLLRTIAGSIAARVKPADIHIYGIDCGNGALLPVADLPHCGCVANGDQVDRVDRLLTRLQAEVSERAAALALAGCSDLDELRRRRGPAHGPPYLVLLLDRWEGFMSMLDDVDGGRLTDAVLRLLREGPAVGLRTVVTTDRSGLVGRIASLVEDKLVLRLGDRSDFALAGLTSRQLPRDLPPGRAVRAGSGTEVQVAVLGTDPSGPGQVAHLRAVAEAATGPLDDTQPRPFRVAELPHRMTYAEMPRREPSSPLWATVGVGGDECLPVGVDLDRDGPALVVAGPARSGRTSALLAIGTSLVDSGARLVVVAARPSALRTLGQTGSTTRVIDAIDLDAAALLRSTLERAEGPLALLVDDAEMVVDTPVGQALEEFARSAPDSLRALVVAGTTSDLLLGYRGFVSEARRHKVGLLLSPESSLDGDLLGVRLPRSVIGRGPRGRGVLAVRGHLTSVQVPLVSAPEPVARATG